MIGVSSWTTIACVNGSTFGSIGFMWPSLRIIGVEPTDRCKSEAPDSTIARKS